MDQQAFHNLDQNAVLIVPTRSLASRIKEQIARHKVAQGAVVWEAPNIVVWSEYLRLLWSINRRSLASHCGAHTLISSQQALLAWTQVIEASRRDEQALTLLNVQQTARAVQRSWRLMHDWRITAEQIQAEHVADTTKFCDWVSEYRQRLEKRALIDEEQFLTLLCGTAISHPFERLIWVSYDLITAAQQAYIDRATHDGVVSDRFQPDRPALQEQHLIYSDSNTEIKAALEQARRLVEQDSEHSISIVVPDLQHRRQQIRELARSVFYPAESPMSIEQQDVVYQFSLGQGLYELPPIEAAISLLKLLGNRTSVADVSFLLRNRFLNVLDEYRAEAGVLEQWLKRQRLHQLSLDHLPSLYLQAVNGQSEGDLPAFFDLLEGLVSARQAVQTRLTKAKQETGFSALSFTDWIDVIDGWLGAWGWQAVVAKSDMSSVQYQLLQRWQSLLLEFSGLATMQRRVGLNRMLEIIQQLARNTIFQPKAAASPIIISGVFEAIGREVDSCFLTGMHQEYPKPWQPDAFVPTRLLNSAGHPDAAADTGYVHAKNVVDSLLACADNRIISYASLNELDAEINQSPSPLFVPTLFKVASELPESFAPDTIELQRYEDSKGPQWSEAARAKGGSKIFENQSLCAFKAFATHRLGFIQDDDAEFGLDGLDRGNVVHHLLNLVWAEIQTQSQLKRMSESERGQLVDVAISQALSDDSGMLTSEKLILLKHEQTRLKSILLAWLELEADRPVSFSVVEREEPREGEISGIGFRYVIDRVDVTEDGRSVIIDYKTGLVNRNDWVGDRLRSPQMPLYALALDQVKHKPASGIAFAQIKQGQLKFIELAEAGIFKTSARWADKYEAMWHENRSAWPEIFTQLAADFLAGEASVNPIDEKVCQYCGLHSLCRLPQLRQAEGEYDF